MPQALFVLASVFYAAFLTVGFSGPPPPQAIATEPPEPEQNNCPQKCGDMHIPYPFGVGSGCSWPGFELTCDKTTSPPSLLTGSIKVANITLETARMVVYTPLAYSCNASSSSTRPTSSPDMVLSVDGPPYFLSPSENVFTAMGCSATANLRAKGDAPYRTGCITSCTSVNPDTLAPLNGTPCSGQGCCQASITPGLSNVSLSVEWNQNEQGGYGVPSNPCQYAFIAAKDWYSFSTADLVDRTFANKLELGNGLGNVVPVVLDWAIRNAPCQPPERPDACVSDQSNCLPASNRTTGYFCKCNQGYTGNPYLKGGCINIDECELRKSPDSTKYKEMYPCRGGTCKDVQGGYECKCNFGRRGDGKSERGCEPILSTPAVAVIGTICGIALLVVLLIFLRMDQQKRKLTDRFNKNGGQLLKSIKIEIFTKEKLDRITKNYSSELGQGAFGKVYQGNTGTGDNTRVAVKCSVAINDGRQKESFANEITIQSNMNHRNLVQLLGCCLETEVPMLVYEFVPKGSLHDVLHIKNDPLPLETRLDIAIYSAVGLMYMHSEASQKILHGDVKSGNILVDNNFVPKVSDFGTSRLMSIDKDHTDWVIGDSSYIDPVYMKTGLLTEKSDVYSFGIVLLELVTRKKARYDGKNSLPINYVKASRDGTARQFIDKEVAANGEEYVDCLEEVGNTALQCLQDDVDDRPNMSEVAERLKVCKRRWMERHGKASLRKWYSRVCVPPG